MILQLNLLSENILRGFFCSVNISFVVCQIGDYILAINGENTENMVQVEAVERLKTIEGAIILDIMHGVLLLDFNLIIIITANLFSMVNGDIRIAICIDIVV